MRAMGIMGDGQKGQRWLWLLVSLAVKISSWHVDCSFAVGQPEVTLEFQRHDPDIVKITSIHCGLAGAKVLEAGCHTIQSQ